jgi:hypothetical protein
MKLRLLVVLSALSVVLFGTEALRAQDTAARRVIVFVYGQSEQFYTDSDDRSAQFRQCWRLPFPRLLAHPRKPAEFASSGYA